MVVVQPPGGPVTSPLALRIRAGIPADVPLVTNSWLRSFRFSAWARDMSNRTYYFYHHRVLEELLPRSTVLVAVSPEDPDAIYGWCCAEVVDTAVVIHYVYVKESYRRLGVARALVKTLLDAERPPLVLYTHQTKASREVAPRYRWVFDPYLLFTKLSPAWSRGEAVES